MRLLSLVSNWWRDTNSPVSFGARGEFEAVQYLKSLGYRIIACGDRGRLGEIDIVAVDGRTIVIVEVKTRRTHKAGHPAEAVDDEKQLRLTRAAYAYLLSHDLLECRCRFDVIAITWPNFEQEPTIEHFTNAFEASGNYGGFY